MLITAIVGLIFNLIMMKILHSDLTGGFGHSCGHDHSHGGHEHGHGHE